MVDKNVIIYGSVLGVFEHIVTIVPRTIIDFKQSTQINNTLQNQLKEKGYARLFKGICPMLLGVSCGHIGLYYFYNKSKQQTNTFNASLFGLTGKIIHDICIVPADMIRMRMNVFNNNCQETIKFVYNKQGIKGFYVGLLPTIITNAPTALIEYGFMNFLCRHYGDDGIKPLLYGGISGAISSLLCTPIDVIKTNLQTTTLRDNKVFSVNHIKSVIKDVYSRKGYIGFFGGSLLRVIQGTCGYGLFHYLSKNFDLNIDDH